MSGIKGGANCQKSSCQNPCKDPCQKVPICVNPCQDPCQSGSQYSGYSNQQGRGQFPKQDPCNPCCPPPCCPPPCCPDPCCPDPCCPDPCQGQGNFYSNK
ncbi:unnamed protein product [Ranitomeya imitator]|uniref:Uncharacterized protein n=1 Tax=Ranitomeya imitator TaxID=111125 RepID=A0ABN9KUG9_9NEOB|nr:unnamed protein product [Ranitomeya imitator]